MNQPKLSLILHQLCCPVSRASLTVRFTVKSGDPPGAGKIWENRFWTKKKWTNRIKKTAKSRRTHAKEPWELVRLCFRSLFWTNESPCDLSYAIIQLKLSVLSLVQTTVGFGNLVSFSTFWGKLIDDLQKSDTRMKSPLLCARQRPEVVEMRNLAAHFGHESINQ